MLAGIVLGLTAAVMFVAGWRHVRALKFWRVELVPTDGMFTE